MDQVEDERDLADWGKDFGRVLGEKENISAEKPRETGETLELRACESR